MDGWIKLHRQLIERGWLKNHNVCIFWIYCLLKATHEPIKIIVGFQEVDLQPGEFVFGRHKASKETGLSEQEIRTCIDSLRKRQNLTIKSTNKFSIISIKNWDTYQNPNNANQPANQPATNQQVTTNKNDKNEKNKYSCANFDLFYRSYPKKKARRDAEKAWSKLNPDESLFQSIMTALEKHKASQDWKKDGGQFIPLPATWINGRRWEDEVKEAGPTW